MGSHKAEHNGKINIAIDGPAGAGKSTVARMVAKALSYVYVDTGAMYRAVTWYMIKQGIKPEQVDLVLEKAKELNIELVPEETGQRVFLNGQDVTHEIRSIEVNGLVSRYAKIEGLRKMLVQMQRQMALRKGVVMDGRDIGTTVLPQAEVKIFMTATVKERALRRFKEMKDAEGITLEQLEHDIAERDRQDEQREISPLRRADDAIVLDTTRLTIDEVVDRIVSYCTIHMDGEK
ncbi:(d)CMP kinase [Paenibacillus sediminis]|uniref:Cytidylate kinase n=1 Tax=Paenibacillus sediminis TaxID=664909 RepID=A0ABS4H0U5_9BACL|nr:(d)CMP kinase [Paenibacillus sediminis]MBP1935740.1 cytidylate kinase [Paenibacillus sediminis]